MHYLAHHRGRDDREGRELGVAEGDKGEDGGGEEGGGGLGFGNSGEEGREDFWGELNEGRELGENHE